MLIGIVAMTESGLIGKGNGLPWHIPDDFKFFRKLTEGKTLVAGRKTWEGMPRLENRKFVLYTRSLDLEETENLRSVSTVEEIVNLAFAKEEYYLIGGAFMFKIFGHLCNYFYVTKVLEDEYTSFTGDVYFPMKILLANYTLISTVPHRDESTGIDLVFELYENKRSR